MSVNDKEAAYALAERFMIATNALRNHIATHSIINYPPGLSPNQLKMLHLVFHRPGITQTHVAERLGVTTASISTSVREMEAQGLIERCSNPDDARVMLLRLAPFGEEIFEQIFTGFTKTCENLLDVLSPEDQEILVKRLEQILTTNNVSIESGKLSYADKLRT